LQHLLLGPIEPRPAGASSRYWPSGLRDFIAQRRETSEREQPAFRPLRDLDHQPVEKKFIDQIGGVAD